MPVNEIEAFSRVLFWACTGLITLSGAATVIVKMVNPYRKIVARINELEASDKKHSDILAKDLLRFEANDERDRMMMEALFTLVEHARTNNSTGLMEETSKKMQAYLIHRK